MPLFIDSSTSFPVGDTSYIPLGGALPSRTEIDEAFSPLILSASGWRKVFAVSGNEEDKDAEIGDANRVLAAHMADSFASYLVGRNGSSWKKELVLGLDTRATGAQIADIMCRVFIARGFTVHYIFISAAPEIMSYARGIGAFAYISASHNPIGHNGVKFGIDDGGVLSGGEIAKMISAFKAACTAGNAAERARNLLASCESEKLVATWNAIGAEKKNALSAYTQFSREVISGESDQAKQKAFFGILENAAIRQKEQGKPVTIVADFNGSARTCSIDRPFFESSGITLCGMNEKPRMIAHRIVPEGESLSYCAREIERLHREGKTPAERNAILGYVPDCDGDRGNIVYWNAREEVCKTLEAQEVFALSVIAEFAHLVYLGHTTVGKGKKANPPLAVAVNDPTSLRIEAIAEAFGARVARAEVGEANVVNLARSLREEGYIVRILGEGSNGGNITHPAAVRDPLNTVFAILKMLIIRDTPEKKGLFHIWCALSGQENKYRDDFTLSDIMLTLPAFVTTSVFENDAMLKIKNLDHASLKRNFQTVFVREWEKKKKSFLSDYGFYSYKAISNNGIIQTEDLSDFGLSLKGGLKIQFYDEAGLPCAFIWMRGSGTEPVFRILADSRGCKVSTERMLLSWLTSMVLEADRKI